MLIIINFEESDFLSIAYTCTCTYAYELVVTMQFNNLIQYVQTPYTKQVVSNTTRTSEVVYLSASIAMEKV